MLFSVHKIVFSNILNIHPKDSLNYNSVFSSNKAGRFNKKLFSETSTILFTLHATKSC